ncbi:MAG: hypothetical protein KH375_07150 [Alistipes sp.]|nr:hypothetical protein [Alistipes sp.]
MKKAIKFIAMLAAVAAFTGCSQSTYLAKNLHQSQTQVVLTQKNFRVVGPAYGESLSTKILGIGGCSKKAIEANAVSEMYKNANLTGAQTIVNINTKKYTHGFRPFYAEIRVVATGQIIEFTE